MKRLFEARKLLLLGLGLIILTANFVSADSFKDWDSDIEHYNEALKKKEDGWTYYQLSYAYGKKKDWDKTAFYAKKAIEFEYSRLDQAYIQLGWALNNKNDYDEAIKWMKKGIELYPQQSKLYRKLTWAYKKKGLYKEAIESAKKEIELKPNRSLTLWAYNDLGLALLRTGKYDEAIIACNKAIEIDPKYLPPYTNIGASYKAKKEYEKALEWLDKALSLNPEKENTYWNLGLVYEKMKDYAQAIANCRKAIELNPDYNKAYQTLEGIYIKKGLEKFENARDIQANFSTGIEMMGGWIRLKGNLWYEKEEKEKFRLEMIAPSGPEIVVSDGNVIWTYLAKKNSVIKELASEENSLQKFLSDIENINSLASSIPSSGKYTLSEKEKDLCELLV